MRCACKTLLTQEQEDNLRRLARGRTLPARLLERSKMLLLYARGDTMEEIAEHLGVVRQTVSRWLHRFVAQGGVEGLEDASRAGRPTKFSPSKRTKVEDAQIKKEAVFALLHTPPSTCGINRTTWRMTDLHRIMREKGEPLALAKIRTIIKKAGYT